MVYFKQQSNEAAAWVSRLQVDTAELQLLYDKGRNFATMTEVEQTHYSMMVNAGMFHHTHVPVGLFYQP